MNDTVDLLRSAIDDAAPNFTEVTTDHLDTPRVTPLGPMRPAGILLFGAQDIFIHPWHVPTTIGATPQLVAFLGRRPSTTTTPTPPARAVAG